MCNLSPSAKIKNNISLDRQAKVIDTISKDPLAGYLFLGPTGVGKTYILYTLANEAVDIGRHVIASTASRIIKSVRDSEFNKEVIPIIDRDSILEYNKVSIFIDELDKIKLTEYSQLILFDLVNLIYDNPDKIVISITSNLPPRAFEDNYGSAFFRKLKEISKLIVYGE
jgi:DNA replication protein DnaC